jgi:hypothetical protein
MKRAAFDIQWRRLAFPDEKLECHGLDPRTLAARLNGATKHGPVIVDALTPTPVSEPGRKHIFVSDDSKPENCWRCDTHISAVDGPCISEAWQPMDTAPTDGTRIVAIGRIEHGDLLRACTTAYHADKTRCPAFVEGWCWLSPGYAAAFYPVGWIPLTGAP